MIFTKKKCIDDRIMKEMHRGVTYWQGKGAYTNEDSLILVTVISKYEISQLKKIVKEIDPKAFIIFNDGMDVTGNFENIQQMQTAVKSGGIIDGISNVLNFTINKVVNSGKIPYALGSAIKTGKNAILNNITKNIESEFENQVNQIEKLNKYTNNWKDYFNNKDFDGMQREYDKIRGKMKEIAPIENTIKTARVIENLHKLIKNNGKNFDLTSEELELAKML